MPAEASAIWDRAVSLLDRLGVVGEIDGLALERYCRYLALWRKAMDTLETEGSIYTGSKGQIVNRPEVGQAAKLGDALLRIEQQFGMTPSARARLARKPDQPEADEDDLFSVAG